MGEVIVKLYPNGLFLHTMSSEKEVRLFAASNPDVICFFMNQEKFAEDKRRWGRKGGR